MGSGTGVVDVLIIGAAGTIIGIGILLGIAYLLFQSSGLAARGRAMYSRRYGF